MKSQRKGRQGEIELSKILNDYGIPARPGNALNFGTEPDIVGIDGIHAEVKRVEKLNVPAAMQQAINDSQRFGGMPALFHRRNRGDWLVTMRLGEWLRLYEGYNNSIEDSMRRTERPSSGTLQGGSPGTVGL